MIKFLKHLKRMRPLNQQITVKLNKKERETLYPVTGGEDQSLKNFEGQNLVLYFYPKDHTPGCTKEGQEFTTLHKEFLKYNTQIIGISRDSITSHESFKAKQKYSFDLLSDKEEKLCRLFKVLEKTDEGRNRLIRSTFVLNSKGQIVYENRKVKVPGHAQSILDFIKKNLI